MGELDNNEQIELVLALNSAYLPTARKTATSVAEKFNFNNSKVEDIKTAVSEAVTFLIDNSSIDNECKSFESNFKIKFSKEANDLKVEINSTMKKNDKFNENALNSIRNYMDDVNLRFDSNSNLNINMIKKY